MPYLQTVLPEEATALRHRPPSLSSQCTSWSGPGTHRPYPRISITESDEHRGGNLLVPRRTPNRSGRRLCRLRGWWRADDPVMARGYWGCGWGRCGERPSAQVRASVGRMLAKRRAASHWDGDGLAEGAGVRSGRCRAPGRRDQTARAASRVSSRAPMTIPAHPPPLPDPGQVTVEGFAGSWRTVSVEPAG